MRNPVRITAVLAMAMLVLCYGPAGAKKKKNKDAKPDSPISAYDKLMKKPGRVSATGSFVSFHKIAGKLYMEFPLKYAGRDMLLASTVAESSNSKIATVGYKNNDPLCLRMVRRDSTMILQRVNSFTESDAELRTALSRNYAFPTFKQFKVQAWTPDSSSVLLDVTDLFLKDVKELSPIAERYSVLKIKSTLKSDCSMLDKIKAFDDNATVETYFTYEYALTFLGSEIGKQDITVKASRTLLLLPEQPMKERIADTRVGTFLTEKENITLEKDGIDRYAVANRWRLEPNDTAAWLRGELVEPQKPIVWYIDDAFPSEWKEPLKQSVLTWNKAFEKIGFKNVMRAVDFPKDDPAFDPDNLKYSCIRYVPINVENAMGPSWVDPRSGEIINATVLVYNDVVKLINNWRFVQTAQLDDRVRTKKMPKSIIDESLTYVFTHEIGHTLGLMHNMGASSAVPVDSLRSVTYTKKYGTTPSIMDYARFNYVAQPTDKGVRMSPPDMGVYDEYVIRWLYSPIKGNLSVKDEARELERWVDEKAGNPLYRYGRQQVSSRYDPSALEEDLGDNAMKAGDYGIKNLKYILSHMSEWITDDESTAHRQELYDAICSQYNRYLLNALTNVGGVYLTEIKDGTTGVRNQAVPRERQREALKWVIAQMRDSQWLDDGELTSKFPLALKRSVSVANMVGKKLFSLNNAVLVSSHISQQPYTQREFFDDLYTEIWKPVIQGRTLTQADKLLQRIAVNEGVSIARKTTGKQLASKLADDLLPLAPGIEEIAAYGLDRTGWVNEHLAELMEFEARNGYGRIASDMLRPVKFGDKSDMGFQNEVKTNLIDESAALHIAMLKKVKALVKSRLASANINDRAHYQAILLSIDGAI